MVGLGVLAILEKVFFCSAASVKGTGSADTPCLAFGPAVLGAGDWVLRGLV